MSKSMLFTEDTTARLCVVSRALTTVWVWFFYLFYACAFFAFSYFFFGNLISPPKFLAYCIAAERAIKGLKRVKRGKVNQYGRKWSRQQRRGGAAGVGGWIQQSHPSPVAGAGEPADPSPGHQFLHRQHIAAGFRQKKGRGRRPRRGQPRVEGEPQQPRRAPDRACGEHGAGGGDLHSAYSYRGQEAGYSRRRAPETPRGERRPVPKLRLRQFPSQLKRSQQVSGHAVASLGLLHPLLGQAFFRLVAPCMRFYYRPSVFSVTWNTP